MHRPTQEYMLHLAVMSLLLPLAFTISLTGLKSRLYILWDDPQPGSICCFLGTRLRS